MTQTRVRTRGGGAIEAIRLMARLSVEDAGKLILDVEDCKEVVLALQMHDLDSERYGYEKGFQEAMFFVRCKPWWKRMFQP